MDDNIILPFQLDESQLRGRAVKLGAALDDVLCPHDYPPPVAHLVAELVGLSLLLSSMIKYDGVFTLQAQGDGPVSMLVADVTTEGKVRGCANFDAERLTAARENLKALKTSEDAQNHLAQYLGKGYLIFTVDQGGLKEPYQGVVELKGSSLIDCVQHYFTQSEQIDTGIKIAAGQRDGKWRGGGIMLQRLPEEHEKEIAKGNVDEDDWRRTMVLLDSASEDEFLDSKLPVKDLLFRLFHEDGIRVYDPQPIEKECRCSMEKVENMLRLMSEDDIEHMRDGDNITMRCEFCAAEFSYDLSELKKK